MKTVLRRRLVRNAAPKRRRRPMKLDPTRSVTQRRRFISLLRVRFSALKRALMRLVADEDAFGLKEREPYLVGNAVGQLTGRPQAGEWSRSIVANDRSECGFNSRPTAIMVNAAREFEFHEDADKIKAFKAWLGRQLDVRIRGRSEQQLWDAYIKQGFEKGAGRSYDDVVSKRPEFYSEPLDFYKGSKAEFLRSSFGQAESVEKVKLLAARTFDDLENVTTTMSNKMVRVLTDGLVEGQHPKVVARALAKEVDIGLTRAKLIAQTEFIRAHAEGQLDALETLGVAEVGVDVEFATADDTAVCSECEDMEGDVYSVEDAHGVIPVHPGCRCAFIPHNDLWEGLGTQNRRFKIRNAFCPTGEGGGIDPTCSPSAADLETLSGYQSGPAQAAWHTKLDKVKSPPAGAEATALQAMRDWSRTNYGGQIQLDELHNKLKAVHPGITVAQQHVLLRRLSQEGKVRLHPWTGSTSRIPSPAHALPMGQELKFYAEAKS